MNLIIRKANNFDSLSLNISASFCIIYSGLRGKMNTPIKLND